MNKGNILKWVEALESNRFQQGTHYLNAYGKLCCLGVACEVAIESGVDLNKWGTYVITYDGLDSTLPDRVQKWLGVDFANPYIGEFTAVTLNDKEAFDFKEIAKAIRKEWLGE